MSMKRCCKQCGRDTNAIYCSNCSPYYRYKTKEEERLRRKDKIETHDDDLIRDEYTEDTEVDPYHGSTTRDDI